MLSDNLFGRKYPLYPNSSLNLPYESPDNPELLPLLDQGDITRALAERYHGENDLPRVAQLTQRTNAFNLSLRRRSLDQIQALGDSYTINVLNAKDRFGDYGLVGVFILRYDKVRNGMFELDTFLLSCRALARGIEEAFLYGIWGESFSSLSLGRGRVSGMVFTPSNPLSMN